MSQIVDGIQRPLEDIYHLSKSVYIPRGVATKALNRAKEWPFKPCDPLSILLSCQLILPSAYSYLRCASS